MNPLRKLRSLVRKNNLDAEMQEEMRAHVEMQTELNIAAGMNADEARYAALRQFGNVASLQERVRDGWTGRWLFDTLRDIRFAARMLARNRGFAFATITTLGLSVAGVGLVGVFYNAIIWSNLPHAREPDRIVTLLSHARNNRWDLRLVSMPAYQEWKQQGRSFEQVAAFTYVGETLGAGNLHAFKSGLRVEPGFFVTLGVEPQLGRIFDDADVSSAAPLTVIISHGLWQEMFQNRADVLGRILRVGASAHTVIGVMPPGFDLPHSRDYWMPLVREGPAFKDRRVRFLDVIGRLRAGVSVEQANAEIAALAAAAAVAHPDTDGDFGAGVVGYWDRITVSFRHDVRLFLSVALALQILASLNTGGLLFSHFLNRAPQLAIRATLGAGRWRLLREMLAESLLLALGALTVGFVLAFALKPLAVAAVSPDYPFPLSLVFRFDWRVLGFTGAASVLTVLACSILPAWRFSDVRLAERMRASGAHVLGRRGSNRLRSLAVVAQLGGTFVLLVYCGLLFQEIRMLRATKLGVDAKGVAMFSIIPAQQKSPDETARFLRQLLDKLATSPGILAAGAGDGMPGQFMQSRIPVVIEAESADSQPATAILRTIVPGTVAAVHIPLLQGRDFGSQDTSTSEPVVLIDRTVATRFFRDERPLGRRISISSDPQNPKWATVVGIVGPTMRFPFDDAAWPAVYQNWFSTPTPRLPTMLVRGNGGVGDTLRTATAVAEEINPAIGIFTSVQGSYARQIAASFWNFRWRGNVTTTFAVLAFLIAAVGVYGLVAYSVRERTKEIGLRHALGATPARVVQAFVRKGVRLVAIGLVSGLAFTLMLGRVFPEFFTFRKTSLHDPVVFSVVGLLLAVISVVACWLPARRAAKVDPIVALRAE